MAETSRAGHAFTNIPISGSARVHLGDAYHYGSSRDEQALRSILESLRYEGMDDRRNDLNSAGRRRGTFEWVLAEKEVDFVIGREFSNRGEIWAESKAINVGFTNWLMGENEDLFCFMGKPGSGKSTLMYGNQ